MIRFLRLAVMAGLVLFGFGAAPSIAQQSTALRMAADDSAPASAAMKRPAKRSPPSRPRPRRVRARRKRAAAQDRSRRRQQAGRNRFRSRALAIGVHFSPRAARTRHAMCSPSRRSASPSKLKRDPAYVFISSRPGENIHNEVSIMMGFPMKDGGDAEADVAGTSFDLVSKGTNAWVKNPAQEAELINAMKKSAKLVVKASLPQGQYDDRQLFARRLHPSPRARREGMPLGWPAAPSAASQGAEKQPLLGGGAFGGSCVPVDPSLDAGCRRNRPDR